MHVSCPAAPRLDMCKARSSVVPKAAMGTSGSQLSTDDFQILGIVGEGGFGTVFLAKRHDRVFAMKRIPKDRVLVGRPLTQQAIAENSILIELLLSGLAEPLSCVRLHWWWGPVPADRQLWQALKQTILMLPRLSSQAVLRRFSGFLNRGFASTSARSASRSSSCTSEALCSPTSSPRT